MPISLPSEESSSLFFRTLLFAAVRGPAAAALYVPRPYPGRVTLFWPERDDETPSDAARWWKRVAAEVELQVLPGDHLSYATKHVEAFARKLRAELDRVAVEPAGRAAAGC
jgi:surfactin synthase thioesterase subunit